MAETQLAKRHREQEEEKEQDNPSTKHHKPHNKDDNQQQPQENQNDPSSLLMITTPLHQEHEPASLANQQQPVVDVGVDKDRDQSLRSVLRHLLEASDDELGIPNNNSNHNNSTDHEADHQVLNPSCSAAAGADSAFDFGEYELWEIEDEAANYYTVLQSQLFM